MNIGFFLKHAGSFFALIMTILVVLIMLSTSSRPIIAGLSSEELRQKGIIIDVDVNWHDIDETMPLHLMGHMPVNW